MRALNNIVGPAMPAFTVAQAAASQSHDTVWRHICDAGSEKGALIAILANVIALSGEL